MAQEMPLVEQLAAVATLGTRRAPLPKELAWPHASLAPLGANAAAPETTLLRAAIAGALWDAAGGRSAPAVASGVARDFPPASGRAVSEPAAWRLARITGGEHPYLLAEWFELAAAGDRVLPARWLPLVLEHVPPELRRDAATVLGPAASWLAARHPRWLVDAPLQSPSDARWKEGSTRERVADLEAVRKHDRVRSRAWLRTTWEQDPPDAREAFLGVLRHTVEPADEELLEMALDDKRKAVRESAVECLARLPDSAFARRQNARVDGLIDFPAEGGGLLSKLRKRKLQIELPTAPDKAAQRDGIDLKVPAARKIGERTFWLAQLVSMLPPRHWTTRFACTPPEFLEAVAATDFARELLEALSAAAVRHPDGEWTLALARAWLEMAAEPQAVLAQLEAMARALPPAARLDFLKAIVPEPKARSTGQAWSLLSSVDVRWDAALTRLACAMLAQVAANEKATWSQPRNSLDTWARNCDRQAGAQGAATLLEKFAEGHPWRNALEQFNDIVAFRATMQQELTS